MRPRRATPSPVDSEEHRRTTHQNNGWTKKSKKRRRTVIFKKNLKIFSKREIKMNLSKLITRLTVAIAPQDCSVSKANYGSEAIWSSSICNRRPNSYGLCLTSRTNLEISAIGGVPWLWSEAFQPVICWIDRAVINFLQWSLVSNCSLGHTSHGVCM